MILKLRTNVGGPDSHLLPWCCVVMGNRFKSRVAQIPSTLNRKFFSNRMGYRFKTIKITRQSEYKRQIWATRSTNTRRKIRKFGMWMETSELV